MISTRKLRATARMPRLAPPLAPHGPQVPPAPAVDLRLDWDNWDDLLGRTAAR